MPNVLGQSPFGTEPGGVAQHGAVLRRPAEPRPAGAQMAQALHARQSIAGRTPPVVGLLCALALSSMARCQVSPAQTTTTYSWRESASGARYIP